MPKTVTLVDDLGKERAVPESEVDYRLARGWSRPTAEQHVATLAREVDEEIYGGAAGTIVGGGAALARGLTGGGSDVLLAGLGAGERLQKLREHNAGVSIAGEALGGLTGAGKLAGRVGAKLAGTGGGSAAQIARAGTAATVEGGIMGAGQGVSELALSDDPLTLERAASVIGSNALFGAAVAGPIGAAGKAVERGLVRAKAAIDDVAARPLGSGIDDVATADIGTLDRKGLRAAEKVELDAIEAAHVPRRAELADEIKALRSEMKEQKIWLATKDADVKAIKEVREVGKIALEADRGIDRMLRNPKALAERPQRVLDGLQQQEHALERLVSQKDVLKPIFAADASGARQAALDYAEKALERNRALQSKIADLTSKPTSARLSAITEATDRLASGGAKSQSFADQMLSGSVYSAASSLVGGLPLVGPMIGAKAASLAARLVDGKLGTATAEAAARASAAVGAFINVTSKVTPKVPVLASRVLNSVAYAPRKKDEEAPKLPLAQAYKARVSEIRSQVQPMPDGSVQMRPDARAKLADRLAPVRAVNPRLADRIETIKAREIEFLASKAPRKPDLFATQLGPDNWQPSDMDMRTWARYVAAVQDPNGIVERLASGTVTPEDAEAMRSVYPEMYADIQQQLMGQLGELRASLPYHRRLALSIFSGVPVDPSFEPQVLTVLQSTFEAEDVPDTAPGPTPQPQFGSVKAEPATPAQERAG